jgi:hypothetical protein
MSRDELVNAPIREDHERVKLMRRLKEWLRGGDSHEELSESALRGSPAGGMGHHHRELDVLPPDDRGAEGGPPSHDDPLRPPVP